MSKNLDDFKEYIKKNPKLKEEVYKKRKTWQELYEEYIILGDKDNNTSDDKKEDNKKESTEDIIKTVVGYIKKIDPDSITKTITSIQKILELIGAITAGGSATMLSKKSTGDPLFDKRFDEWY